MMMRRIMIFCDNDYDDDDDNDRKLKFFFHFISNFTSHNVHTSSVNICLLNLYLYLFIFIKIQDHFDNRLKINNTTATNEKKKNKQLCVGEYFFFIGQKFIGINYFFWYYQMVDINEQKSIEKKFGQRILQLYRLTKKK